MKEVFQRVRSRACLAVALVALALLSFAAPAGAEQFPPAPQEDDVAFVQLGAVAELVTLRLYRAAAADQALEPRERRTFGRLAKQQAKSFAGLNKLLGDDELTDSDFGVRIPGEVLRSAAKTTALAARFERLLAGLYLSGVQSTIDPPTRLLIGKRLAAASRDLTLIRALRGEKLNLKPLRRLSVEYVGIQFDRYLTIPGA